MSNILKYPPSHPVMFNGIFEDKEILTSFLNSTELFNIKENEEFIFNKQSIEDGIDLLTPVMDLRITIGVNKYLNVEMQNRKPNEYDIHFRLGFYLGKLISKSQKKGENYKTKECSVFAILNFKLYSDDKYIRTFKFRDENNIEIQHFKIIVLELTKIKNCDKNKLKKWMDFLNSKNLSSFIGDDEEMDETFEKAFEKAIQKALELNNSRELDQLMDAWENLEREMAARLEEGKRLGIELGIEQGIQQGIQQGINKKNLENAKRMKEKGYPIEDIVDITGLTKEEIEKL